MIIPIIIGLLASWGVVRAVEGQSMLPYPWTGGDDNPTPSPGPTTPRAGTRCMGPPGQENVPHRWDERGLCVPESYVVQPSPVILPPGQIDTRAPAQATSNTQLFTRAALLAVGVFLGLRVVTAIAKVTLGVGGPTTTRIVERPIYVTAKRKPRTRYVPGEKNGRKGVFVQRPGSRAMVFKAYPRTTRRR